MKFAHPYWLLGTSVGIAVAAALIAAGFLLVRARRRFGDEDAVRKLVTENATNRRTAKGVLLTLAVALGFVALAQPQYGRGTRTIPATNLDVVLVLDYSKSMYARDVTPSRSERAKAEVARLVQTLPGARFAAVAFAGEPIAFPLTSDGGAIAQFFRQLTPNDMPVGGTAIGRALEWGLDLLRRDPQSSKHRRVMILITDGEDLEGDPVAVAKSAASEGVTVHVVQIGGRTPEPIPDVKGDGTIAGMRRDDDGKLITTSLSAEGEEQLAAVASAGGGNVVRGDTGMTGIETITRNMKRMMTEELSETVETVYADVYAYPAGLALLLLLLEAFVASARKRVVAEPEARVHKETLGARLRAERAQRLGNTLLVLLVLVATGCEHYEEKIFIRHAPAVDDAIDKLNAKEAEGAASLLEGYLETGQCKDGVIGSGARVRKLPNAAFDLGLALFRLGETFGQPFDAPPSPVGANEDSSQQEQLVKRSQEVECALVIVQAIASDHDVPLDLRADAYYLAGNLEFLRGDYESAVTMYDDALRLSPGLEASEGSAGAGARTPTSVGNLAAWNRSIALKRIEEQEQDQDEQDQDEQDQDEQKDDEKDDEKDDAEQKQDEQKQDEQKQDEQKQDEQKQDEQGASQEQQQRPPTQAARSQDDRVLDMLESAPTLQQEAARRSGASRRVSGRRDR